MKFSQEMLSKQLQSLQDDALYFDEHDLKIMDREIAQQCSLDPKPEPKHTKDVKDIDVELDMANLLAFSSVE